MTDFDANGDGSFTGATIASNDLAGNQAYTNVIVNDTAAWMTGKNVEQLDSTIGAVPNISFITLAAMVNGLAKAVYATVLTDLGQSNFSNALADPERTIHLATQAAELLTPGKPDWPNFSALVSLSEGPLPSGSPPLDHSAAFFAWFNTSLPAATPSTISAQYLCQVPVRKPWGSLLVSVLVADLVFLQVFWKVLNWAVVSGLERRHPDARYCLGCGGGGGGGGGEEKKLRQQDGDYEMLLQHTKAAPSQAAGTKNESDESDAFSPGPKLMMRAVAEVSEDDESHSVRLRSIPRKAVGSAISHEP